MISKCHAGQWGCDLLCNLINCVILSLQQHPYRQKPNVQVIRDATAIQIDQSDHLLIYDLIRYGWSTPPEYIRDTCQSCVTTYTHSVLAGHSPHVQFVIISVDGHSITAVAGQFIHSFQSVRPLNIIIYRMWQQFTGHGVVRTCMNDVLLRPITLWTIRNTFDNTDQSVDFTLNLWGRVPTMRKHLQSYFNLFGPPLTLYWSICLQCWMQSISTLK